MIPPTPPCTYVSLTGAELVEMLTATGSTPELLTDWAENNARPDGHLRAVVSAWLPWEAEGQIIDALAWPDGHLMISPRVYNALGGVL